MKKRKLLLVFGLLLTIGLISGTYFTNTDFFIEKDQSSGFDNQEVFFDPIKIDPVKKFDPYKSAWKEIDSLANKGLYKSASEKIDVLVTRAKKEENHPMIIKGYLYKLW